MDPVHLCQSNKTIQGSAYQRGFIESSVSALLTIFESLQRCSLLCKITFSMIEFVGWWDSLMHIMAY